MSFKWRKNDYRAKQAITEYADSISLSYRLIIGWTPTPGVEASAAASMAPD